MSSRFVDYPSPRGVHVETHGEHVEHNSTPRRNRYSRSSQQTPRIRDVAWISTPERSVLPTPQTPSTRSQWLPSSQAPPSPGNRPPGFIPPSPAPTERLIGEHMVVDDVVFPEDPYADPYQPKRQGGGFRMMKSILKGLKKLSGFSPQRFPRMGSVSYDSAPTQATSASIPVIPVISSQSASSNYGNPTPSETEEQHRASPYNSPYVRPQTPGVTPAVIRGSLRAPSPVPSVEIVPPVRISSPYVRPPNLGATPALIPGSLRQASPVPSTEPNIVSSPCVRQSTPGATPAVIPGSHRASPAPSHGSVPPITIISPSPVLASHPASFTTPVPNASPAVQQLRDLLVATDEPAAEEGSQTLHDHTYPNAVPPPLVIGPPSTYLPSHVPPTKPVNFSPVDSPAKGSLASTVARVRRFVAELDELPWVSDEQVADVYVPEENPRSRLRAQIRQGADPSWYNGRPEVIERPQAWAEWDMWAKQSAAALMWEGGRSVGWDGLVYSDGSRDDHEFGKEDGAFGTARYPHGGFVPAQPVFVNASGYPPPGQISGPVLM